MPGTAGSTSPLLSDKFCAAHLALPAEHRPGKKPCMVHLEAEGMLLGLAIHLQKSSWKQRLCCLLPVLELGCSRSLWSAPGAVLL